MSVRESQQNENNFCRKNVELINNESNKNVDTYCVATQQISDSKTPQTDVTAEDVEEEEKDI